MDGHWYANTYGLFMGRWYGNPAPVPRPESLPPANGFCARLLAQSADDPDNWILAVGAGTKADAIRQAGVRDDAPTDPDNVCNEVAKMRFTDDRGENYLVSNGMGSVQWFKYLAPANPGNDTDNPIRRVGVTWCARRKAKTEEPFYEQSTFTIGVGVGSDRWDLDTGRWQQAEACWTTGTEWFDRSPIPTGRPGGDEFEPWTWAMLNDLFVGVKALVRGTYTEEVIECPDDIRIQWLSDADTELTWLEVVVECGTPWKPCPRCCCCCMCFTPTIIFEAGAFTLVTPDSVTHVSPRMCSTVCYQGRLPPEIDVNTPCWYYNQEVDPDDFPDALCNEPINRFLGTSVGGPDDAWYGGIATIVASPISGEGGEPCLSVLFTFNCVFPAPGGLFYAYNLQFLATPELLQCDPFHRSSIPVADGRLQYVGGINIPYQGVGSEWQNAVGDMVVTCAAIGEECSEL